MNCLSNSLDVSAVSQDFGQISGIISSILPKDPNQEPCSPVRKVSEIQPLTLSIPDVLQKWSDPCWSQVKSLQFPNFNLNISSHFKEIIPSSKLLVFGRYSKLQSRKSWTPKYLVVISTRQITIIPKPKSFGYCFGDSFLKKPPFGVTSNLIIRYNLLRSHHLRSPCAMKLGGMDGDCESSPWTTEFSLPIAWRANEPLGVAIKHI